MPEFPFVQGGVVRTAGTVAGTSSQATTVTGGAANTKGTVVELIAATEFDANWIIVQFTNASGGFNGLADILIGSSIEQVIVPDLFIRPQAGVGDWPPYLLPVYIPKGSRLSARIQSSGGASTININVVLIAGTLIGGGQSPSWVSAYGAVASSLGTSLDPGATPDTDTAWTQMTAATDRAHNWLCVSGRFGDAALTATPVWRVSLGIGAATEQVLVPDLQFSAETSGDQPRCPVVCFPCFVPAASRITAKARCNSGTAGDRAINLKIYGAG